MKFSQFGKTVLTAALSSAIVFSLSSCIRSFTVGYLFVTGTVTSTPPGQGIITGFKIDNNTGKLNPLHGLPVGSGGSNPVRAVLLTGGNFVYVLNQGANKEGNLNCTFSDPCLNSNITEFVVGGNGILTAQETFFTQGLNPFRLIQDTSGNFLLALDHDAPNSGANPNCSVTSPTGTATACGDVTVFSINQTTGRLTLVTNAQLTASTGSQIPYFPVPSNPIDFTLASGYVYTLAGAPGSSPTVPPATGQVVFPYTYNTSSGQLATATNTPQTIFGALNGGTSPLGQATAIINAGGKIYILDNEPTTTGGTPGQILTFTPGGANGNLASLVGGTVADDPSETDPIQLIVDSKSKFLYVANQQGAGSNDAAGIAEFVIDPSSSQLSLNPGGIANHVGTGALPQCILEDPSDQYIYTANYDGTVSGHLLDPNSGLLNVLKGSTGTFALTGPATWCVVTGRTS